MIPRAYALGATMAVAGAIEAQESGSRAQPGPPIRRIATASAISRQSFGSLTDVQELSGGRLLVNDGGRRQLLLLDTTLTLVRVVLDSMSETENTYGNRVGTLVGYLADSSLFIDPASLALLILDPEANVARVRSVPRVQDVQWYVSRTGGFTRAGTDARGRLVYRISARPQRPSRPPPRGVPYFPPQPDSAFVVAIDLETRLVDTLGSIRIPKSDYVVRLTPTGGYDVDQAINPLPMTDEWAVLPDGSVAFVRGIDYRVEYLDGDGRWTSSPKLPYDWQPMSEEAKKQLVDSVRAAEVANARTSYTTSVIRWVNQYGRRRYPGGFTAPEGYRPPQGFGRDWALPPGVFFPENYIYACAPGEEPTMAERPAGAADVDSEAPAAAREVSARGREPGVGRPSCIPAPVPNTNPPPAPRLREPGVVSAQLLPDFRPPFATGAVRADADGNLWIRTITPRRGSGGIVYDIVNRAGELVDRLQLPPGYQIVGFGKGKVVYLAMREAGAMKLARVNLR